MFNAPPDYDELCRCGCGREGIPARVADAVLLGAARSTAQTLEEKLISGGWRKAMATDLLWAWGRCSGPLDGWVHGRWRPPTDKPALLTERHAAVLGPPTPAWVAGWRARAEHLDRSRDSGALGLLRNALRLMRRGAGRR